VLTLSGGGGGGKTRLALRFAQEQLAAFPDGLWFGMVYVPYGGQDNPSGGIIAYGLCQ
jgi:hypothetical protein